MFIIGNGTIVTHDENNTVLTDGAVVTSGNRIIDYGPYSQMKRIYNKASFINAKGGLILPGFIDAHEHIYSMMARGMAVSLPQKADLVQILQNLWWKLDSKLTNDMTYKSARMAYLELVKNGVTTVFDHHASYGEISNSLSVIAQAAEEFSVKSCLCFEVSDRAGKDKMREAVLENERFMKETAKSQVLTGIMGLHASFTLSDETLEYCRQHSNGSYHVHVAEGAIDQADCIKNYHMRIMERFNKFGILGPDTMAAHCIDISENEMEIIRNTGTAVIHNPQSNMNNAAGCPPILQMIHKGILVGLGTDGYTHDMLESYKTAGLLQKHNLQDAAAGFAEINEAMFANNRQLVTRHFGMKTGIIKNGCTADIIIADYNPPTPLTAANINGHILFGINGNNITFTMAQGNIIMKDRELLNIDEEKIIKDCRQGANKLWQKLI